MRFRPGSRRERGDGGATARALAAGAGALCSGATGGTPTSGGRGRSPPDTGNPHASSAAVASAKANRARFPHLILAASGRRSTSP